MNRKEILLAAEACVCGQRDQDYGSPESSFDLIAQFWRAYVEESCLDDDGNFAGINGADVAAMMALLKIARIANNQAHDDSWIDLAGYAACGGEIRERKNSR